MLIVIPVSSADAGLIQPFTDALQHCGPNTGYDALVVARPSDAEYAKTLREKLAGLFDQVALHIFEQDGPTGWPQGPNFYFSSTVHFLRSQQPRPWFWMELDTTALKSGWASALETEYNLAKAPFMGAIEKTYATNAEGVEVDAGRHLVGVAVYPPDLSQFSTLWPFLPKMNTPFDVVCQWEFLPKVHETKLLQHCFRTQNYTKSEDGEIRGEDNNKFPLGVRFDRPLSPDAVLLHGCDDGSLAKLLTAKLETDDEPKEPEKPAQTKPVLDAELLAPTPKRKVRFD